MGMMCGMGVYRRKIIFWMIWRVGSWVYYFDRWMDGWIERWMR